MNEDLPERVHAALGVELMEVERHQQELQKVRRPAGL